MMHPRVAGRMVAALSVLGLPLWAAARSFDGAGFPSTPFLPPRGYEWVVALFLALFTLANGFVLRRDWQFTRKHALWTALGGGAAIAATAFLVIPMLKDWLIRDAFRYTRIPFLGWDWRYAIDDFLRVNAISAALLLLGVACLAYLHPRSPSRREFLPWLALIAVVLFVSGALMDSYLYMDSAYIVYALLLLLLATGGVMLVRLLRWRSVLVLGVNLLVYLLCLLPYLCTGALMFGSGPWQNCRSRQMSMGLGPALVAYAHAHDGRLPDGRSMRAAFVQLKPYYDKTYAGAMTSSAGQRFFSPLICQAGTWYARHPRTYRWNAAMAGRSIAELRALPHSVPLIACPYHPSFYLDSADIVAAYDDPDEVLSIDVVHSNAR